jgi:hypothetical protein
MAAGAGANTVAALPTTRVQASSLARIIGPTSTLDAARSYVKPVPLASSRLPKCRVVRGAGRGSAQRDAVRQAVQLGDQTSMALGDRVQVFCEP